MRKEGKIGLIVWLIIFISSVSFVIAGNGDEYRCCNSLGVWPWEAKAELYVTTQNINDGTPCPLPRDYWADPKPDAISLYQGLNTHISFDWTGASQRYKGPDVASCVEPPTCLDKDIYDILGDASDYCYLNGKVFLIDDDYPKYEPFSLNKTYNNTFKGDWQIRSIKGNYRDLKNEKLLIAHWNNYDTLPKDDMRVIRSTWVYVENKIENLDSIISTYHQASLVVYKLSRKEDKLEEIFVHSYGPGSHSRRMPDLEPGWYLLRVDYVGWKDQENVLGIAFQNPGNSVDIPLKDLFMSINSYGPLSMNGDKSNVTCEDDPYYDGYWTDSLNVLAERKCCGDDIEDFGYYDAAWNKGAGGVCTKSGWKEKQTECTKPDGGNYEYVTHFLPEAIPDNLYNSLATNGLDRCCGDDTTCAGVNQFNCDYGYVSPNKKYICYNSKYALKNPSEEDEWVWLNADNTDKSFTTLNLISDYPQKNKSIDIISNANEWFYCNANSPQTTGLKANAISEYASFTNKQSSNTMSCADFMTIMSPSLQKFGVCSAASPPPCCDGDISLITGEHNCLCQVSATGSLHDICSYISLYPFLIPLCNPNSGLPADSDYINKMLCNFDLSGCLSSTYYHKNLDCENQPNGYGKKCAGTNICKKGVFVKTLNTDECCFGPDSECVAPPTIGDEQVCVLENGAVYTTQSQECNGYSVPITGSEKRCCFGLVFSNSLFFNGLSGINNNSFMCFKQNGNSVLSQCCYGSDCSKNFVWKTNAYIDTSISRIKSQGTTIHTVASYDQLENDLIVDYVRRLRPVNNEIKFQIFNKLNLSDFEYLEFDIAFTDNSLTDLYFNNVNYGPIYGYLTNGIEPMRWHHMVVKIRSAEKNQQLASDMVIKRQNVNIDTRVLIDNVILTPTSQSESSNYYCTGGFGSWISGLDPPLGIDFGNWLSYGPYKFACEAQASFGWTGRNCCGDDTRFNYGEHYNDTLAGCFNATFMLNGWSVAKAKGVIESDVLFKNYYFRDLLYYNNTYFGCQIGNKYEHLKVSYDGQTLSNSKLVNNKADTQCAVIADYYCSHSAWRQIVPGVNKWTNISLKSSPPGTELIKNGDFGGDAPIAPLPPLKDPKQNRGEVVK